MAEPPRLRDLTAARIALGRIGQALPTRPMLDFQLAHARARDAVHTELQSDALGDRPVIEVRSQASDRATYLQRPDLGRRLNPDDVGKLTKSGNLVLIVGDGLSAAAVHFHAAPLLQALLDRLESYMPDLTQSCPRHPGPVPGSTGEQEMAAGNWPPAAPKSTLRQDRRWTPEQVRGDQDEYISSASWTIAPVILAHHARVALGDEIGAAIGADLAIMLIGERPGLSAPDSLGAYLTWAPRPGRRDSERNCVSNIRPPEGLGYAEAADRIAWLAREARVRRLTGVALKDESSTPRIA